MRGTNQGTGRRQEDRDRGQASPNGTGQELLDEYTEDSEIKVILNPENSGFAKGNNMGVRWVQENVPADFVVVLNNDVEILQKDFCPKVEAIYRRHSFDVLGPDIISVFSGIHQNPKSLHGYSLESVRKKREKVARTKNPILLLLSSRRKEQPGNLEESTAQKKSKTVYRQQYPYGGKCTAWFLRDFFQTLSEKASGAILSEDLYVF